MLKITSAAWERLAQLLTTRPNVTAIRLTYADGNFKCRRGDRRDRDRVIEHADGPTLLMSPVVANDLANRTLDAPDTKRGPRLRLKPEYASEKR